MLVLSKRSAFLIRESRLLSASQTVRTAIDESLAQLVRLHHFTFHHFTVMCSSDYQIQWRPSSKQYSNGYKLYYLLYLSKTQYPEI